MASENSRTKRSIELTDPRALRALAHPARMRLIALLRNIGPLTATQAAEHVGESPSNCSFHLRQLARWELVEQAGGGKGRERPWRATAQFTNWQQSPVRGEGGEARIALDRVLVQGYLDQIGDWFDRRPSEDDEWLAVSGLGDLSLHLTAEELRVLEKRIDTLVEPYVQRSTRPEDRPVGSRQVTFIHALLPDRKDGPADRSVE
ncbi:MAG: helix-turn-helix transcriptional regulator [Acidobacteria bacterium]|nr:helix-turn-helix transcriptional regulator [Acidobacteriota bacterium]